jgi:Uncharacterised nucleotidyltransferase
MVVNGNTWRRTRPMTRNTTASASRSLSPAGALRNFDKRLVSNPLLQILDSTDLEINTETKILCCCSRISLGSGEVDRLQSLLQHRIDWDYLIALARKHRLSALLYHHLKNATPGAVPAAARKQLEKLFHFNLAGNLILARELVAILASFRDSRIGILPLKGISAAAGIYGSLALRSTGDLDLLIHRRDLASAKALLEARGFQLWDTAGDDATNPSTLLEIHMYRPADQILVELRWRVTPSYFSGSLDLDYLGEYIRPLQLMETEVPGLPPEELLVTLCIHGSKHQWDRLIWVCDVAELLRAHPGLDWQRVARHAARLGVGRAILCGLLVARTILDAPVPEVALNGIASGNAGHLAASQACGELFIDLPARQNIRYHLRLMERRGDQLRYLALIAQSKLRQLRPNDLDRAFLPLPKALDFLYFIIRPARLLVQYGVSPIVRK